MNNQESIWNKEYIEHKDKWHKETTSLPQIKENSKVLELGVGNGKTLKAILKQNPQIVIAMDFSKEAIRQAKSKITSNIVKFVKSDVRELKINKTDKFDVIVCYYILNNLLSKEILILVNKLHNILNTNGQIYFQDFAKGDFRQYAKNKIIEKNTIQKSNGLICHFFTEKELKIIFKEFSKIKISTKTSRPITHKPKLKRKIISAIIIK